MEKCTKNHVLMVAVSFIFMLLGGFFFLLTSFITLFYGAKTPDTVILISGVIFLTGLVVSVYYKLHEELFH